MKRTSSISRTLGLCLALGSSFGCAAGGETESSEDMVVSSNVEQGLLARIDYKNGSYVEFLRADDGMVFIGGVFDQSGADPLRGVQLSKVLPSELFSYLTGSEAPADLLDAEREAGLVSNPDALGFLSDDAAEGDLGTQSQGLDGNRFNELYCYPGVDYCGLSVPGNLRVDGDGRVDSVDGKLNVLSGSLRMRIFRKRLVRGDDLLASYIVSADPSDPVVHIGAATPGLDRKMWITVDNADSATYHFAANFHD